MFVPRKTYNRRSDLHRLYGGQRQGGISTPSNQSFIMLFTGKQGRQYGYQDGWTDEGVFFYTGEGQRGDMPFVRGNAAIRDHINNGKDLHLFEYLNRGKVRYIGQMVCTGYQERSGPDIDGNMRRVIVFELTPISEFDITDLQRGESEEEMWSVPLSTLRERALASSVIPRNASERKVLTKLRSNAIRVYVLRRAKGVCEACRKDAPFRTETGRPYLEPHHIRRLSDGGPDDPRWVIGVCPNCHRRAHYGEGGHIFNRQLVQIVNDKEDEQ